MRVPAKNHNSVGEVLPMRTTSRLLLLLLAAVAACTQRPPQATQQSSQPVGDDSAAAGTDLAGEWRAQLQFSSGAFVSMKDLEFMYSFNQGGTMTESSNYDASPPVPPAYGIWRKVGPKEFEAKYEFFVTKPPAKFDEIVKGGGWGLAGRGVFVEHITLSDDGKSFTSKMKYDQFDTAGKPAEGGGEATGKGVRLAF
jgi:hypothetical protein